MEAPETIFVTPLGYGCLSEPYIDKMFASQIEYVRKDAFIEKASKFLFDNYHGEKLSLKMIENFKKYMKE